MTLKKTFFFLSIVFLLSACGTNGIVYKADENIKNIQLGMTKDEVIRVLGNRYLISSSSKDVNGNTIEVLSYKSDVAEEYKLHFLSNILKEWNREHIQKYIVKDSK